MKTKKNFLVFTSAGDNANLDMWLDGHRNFDLCITYYGNKKDHYKELTPFYLQNKDAKFPNLLLWHRNNPGFLQQYAAIMVIDDDVILSCEDINQLFKWQQKMDLWLLQPAFSPKGKVSHITTQHKPGYKLRYTNFVEMTCPIFRTDKLLSFLEVFDPSLKGWGTDYWFTQHLGGTQDRIAIIDAVPCINPFDETKPRGKREIDRLQSTETRRQTWFDLADKLGLEATRENEIYREIKKSFISRYYIRLMRQLSVRRN